MSPSPPICKYYNTVRGCRYGDRCRFAHPPDQTEPLDCRFYNTAQGCKYGSECIFKHTEKPSVCFKCKQEFPGTSELRHHFSDILKRTKHDHLEFIFNNPKSAGSFDCAACDINYKSTKALLQHIGGKADNDHQLFLNEIIAHFVARSLDSTKEENDWINELLDEILEKNIDKDVLARHLHALIGAMHLDSDGSNSEFESEMDERMMNGGFTDDEVNDLLCQGVKPWDEDAWDVLAVLNGDYY